MDSKSYLSSLEILSNDFRRLTEFIEPVDANLSTYSHRLYELLLRTCTDFESACKEKLIVDGYSKAPKDMNIYDYKTLEATLALRKVEVGMLIWRPSVAYVRPFANWSTAVPPLSWYSAYNEVKHNRSVQFSQANLENVRLAFAGLFALLVRLDIVTISERGGSEQGGGGFTELFFTGHIFSFRYPM